LVQMSQVNLNCLQQPATATTTSNNRYNRQSLVSLFLGLSFLSLLHSLKTICIVVAVTFLSFSFICCLITLTVPCPSLSTLNTPSFYTLLQTFSLSLSSYLCIRSSKKHRERFVVYKLLLA